MPSSSAELTPQQQWLGERRDATLARFDARMPALYTDPVALPQPAADWAASGADQTGSLFLTGPIGVGKTHAAWWTARAWLAAYCGRALRGTPDIQWWRSTALFDALRPDGDNPRGIAARCQRADLLVVDDLAAARVSPTGWTQEQLYELFDERYVQRRPVLITCDVLPKDLSPVVGPRVASRLAEMCRGGVHLMQGGDRRKGGAR